VAFPFADCKVGMSEPVQNTTAPMDEEVGVAAHDAAVHDVLDGQPSSALVDGYLPTPPKRAWADIVEEEEASSASTASADATSPS
jgi:hypothetical protein